MLTCHDCHCNQNQTRPRFLPTKDNQPVAVFPTFDFHSVSGLPLRKRFFLELDSTLLVTIPSGDDHLVLREIRH